MLPPFPPPDPEAHRVPIGVPATAFPVLYALPPSPSPLPTKVPPPLHPIFSSARTAFGPPPRLASPSKNLRPSLPSSPPNSNYPPFSPPPPLPLPSPHLLNPTSRSLTQAQPQPSIQWEPHPSRQKKCTSASNHTMQASVLGRVQTNSVHPLEPSPD